MNNQTIKLGILCHQPLIEKQIRKRVIHHFLLRKEKQGLWTFPVSFFFFLMFYIGWFCHQGDQIPTLTVLDICQNINQCFCANGHQGIIT